MWRYSSWAGQNLDVRDRLFAVARGFSDDRIAAAIDPQRGLGAEETLGVRAVLVAAADPHRVLEDEPVLRHRAGTVFGDGRKGVGPLAVVVRESELPAVGADGLRPPDAHRPMDDVEVVDAPGHLVAAAGNLEPVVAVVVVAVGIVGHHRRRADVEIPVQFLGRIAVGRRAPSGRPVFVVPHLHFRDLAQAGPTG